MNCDTVRERLDTLADGELGVWAAWNVQRHLAHCPGCAGEFASIRRLTARARAWQDVAAPAALRERMPLPSTPRPPHIAWHPAFALGVGTAVVAATALLTPGQPGRPTITFADVQAVLEAANIVSFDSTRNDHDHNRFRDKVVSHIWIRRNPPAIASVSWPDECLPSGNTQPKTLTDARGELTYWIPGKSSWMSEPYYIYKGRGATLSKGVQSWWLMLTGPFSSQTLVPKTYGEVGTPMRTETATLDGRSVLTFMRRYRYPNGGNVSRCVQTIFVDPQTRHVIRIEGTTQTGVLLSTEVDTNFRYDAVPPPGTFDWSPPKGAKLEVTK